MGIVVPKTGSEGIGPIQRHAMLLVLVLAYVALSTLVRLRYGLDVELATVGVLANHFLSKVPQILILVLVWRLLQLTYVEKAPDRFAALRAEVTGFLTDWNRLANGLVAAVLMSSVLLAFAQFKSLIPLIQPFAWDEIFAGLDRSLHLGVDPYAPLHALLGGDLSLTFFGGLYNLWLFLAYFTLFATCFLRPESEVRMQFLVAFLLTWAIGGNLLATAFSSAGPPYYALLGLGGQYLPLFDRLADHAAAGGLSVLDTQQLLWKFYTAPDSINSISAFPSMHVASSVLMAILGLALSRWVGLALGLFAACIMLGSVLLGWHYAVDGYAGALIAVFSWKVSGWLIRSPIGPFFRPAC